MDTLLRKAGGMFSFLQTGNMHHKSPTSETLHEADCEASAAEREQALREFAASLHQTATESETAVIRAKEALERLTEAIVGGDNGQAVRVRNMLRSIYSAGATLADFSDLMTLDWAVRKDLCAVLLAFGCGDLDYAYLRRAFEAAGDEGARWFLGSN
jgi:hypothetical protein